MADVDELLRMFRNAGIKAEHDLRQSKIGSPLGSSIVYVEQPPGFYNRTTLYVLFDIGPDGELRGLQMNH